MDTQRVGRKRHGFTLIELLVIIGIVAVSAAILFPVFAGARERGRRTQCLSNERQLGIAIMQYAADNNDALFTGKSYLPSLGWAGRCYPYVRSVSVFRCPDDATADVSAGGDGSINGLAMSAISYGFNSLIAGQESAGSQPAILPVTVGQIAGPDRTVLLFEISGNVAALLVPGADDQSVWGSMTLGATFGGLNALETDPTFPVGYSPVPSHLVLYATGNMGGVLLNGATKNGSVLPGEKGSVPRHGDGANYVTCDGHVVWLRPEQVWSDNSAEAGVYPPVGGGAEAKYVLTFRNK